MVSRYDDREIFRNEAPEYKKKFKERGVSNIVHYETAKLKHPTQTQIESLELEKHVWKTGDKYYKLAHRYYSDTELWWVIAHFNKKPTDSDNELGDIVMIPFPLDRVLNYMGL